jgi:nitrous oxidase accessory protein NosD
MNAAIPMFGIRIQNIGFAFTTNTVGQIAIRFQQDLRFSIIEGCAFAGGGALTTSIGIQLDGGGTFVGDVVIRDNYFSGLFVGTYLRGNCTTVKVVNNEFYGYSGAASAVNGYGVEIDYPAVEPVLIGNYFEGWTYGIYSAGAAQVRQLGNDFAVCTQGFNWVKTSYSNVKINRSETTSTTQGLAYTARPTLMATWSSAGRWDFLSPANSCRAFGDFRKAQAQAPRCALTELAIRRQ